MASPIHTLIGGRPQTSLRVSVLIVNWRSRSYTEGCLRSLYAHSLTTALEVIVVDCASYDGCGELIARQFPSVRFVQSSINLGFAKANNIIASQAIGDYLLFLNPDTELFEDSIARLVATADQLPNVGAIGCTLLNADRTLQSSCIQPFPTVTNRLIDSHYFRERFPKAQLWGCAALYDGDHHPKRVDAISGACLMVRANAFRAVGGFSEHYFMYGEDVDLCYKITKQGCSVFYTPETAVIHFGGRSSGQHTNQFANVWLRESTFRFFKQHRGVAAASTYRAATSLLAAIRLVIIACLLPVRGNRLVRHGTGSLQKWAYIFCWSIGLIPSVTRDRSAAAPSNGNSLGEL